MPYGLTWLHCLRLDMSFHKARELIERVDGDVNAPSVFSPTYPACVGQCHPAVRHPPITKIGSWAKPDRVCPHCPDYPDAPALLCYPYWAAYRQVSAEFFGFLGNTWLAPKTCEPMVPLATSCAASTKSCSAGCLSTTRPASRDNSLGNYACSPLAKRSP